MTSRERVRRTLNFEEPDRVPIDFGGYTCGINENAYSDLLNYLNVSGEIQIYDNIQRLAMVDEEILNRFHVDTRSIYTNPPSNWQFQEAPDNSWVDQWGVKRKRVGYYYETVDNPLKEATIPDVDNYKLPDPTDSARFEGLSVTVKKMYDETEYALISADSGGILYLATELIGWEKYLTDLILNQKLIIKLTDILLDWHMQYFGKLLDTCGEFIEMLWLDDDWGQQTGPIMQPEIFRKIYKPRLEKLVSFIKTKTDAKVCYHSCGSIYWALEDFIDVGIDVVNPVQVSAKDMDTKKLKEEFGDRICFWGGTCDTQRILPFGTADDVKAEVEKRICDLAPGGGFVAATVHNIQAGVPPENIIAFFNKVADFGRYPIEC
ncbi:MAG: uroporphyrinogen-III decarboxylase [Spirochaetota bacterium]|nr:MAG: uroporphyrinogen-III decarboxylase [Spirochaetota bacterium]